MSEEAPSKAELTYQRMVGSLPSRNRLESRAAEPVVDEETFVYEHALRQMSEPLRQAMEQQIPETKEAAESQEMRWCICESPEGEFARVRIFGSLESLVRYMGKLEGKETSVWPFYGVAMRFTKPLPRYHDRRLLLLPGEEEVISIPCHHAEPANTAALDAIEPIDDAEFQANGWMGIPELAYGSDDEYSQGDAEIRQQRAALPPPNPEDDSDDHNSEESVPS